MINKSNINYIFCDKPFKYFLEGESSKDKPTPLLVIKILSFWYGGISFLYT